MPSTARLFTPRPDPSPAAHRPRSRHQALAAVALALLTSLPALAAAVAPPADLSACVCSGHCGGLAADGDITLSPLGSPRYGFVTTSDSSASGVSPLALDANSDGAGLGAAQTIQGVP